jgi:aryl-alcohol dehydrogenase-like predicted oxidoreductase
MEQVRLGNTGLKVSRLCLGCMTYGSPKWRSWVLDEAQAKPFFQLAIEKGVTFFDTANVYSIGASEEVTGKWLREFARREEIVVATKVNGPMGPGPNERGLSRKAILAQIDASLTRLGMDYVDLYQIHRFDYETPIEETLEALNDVVRAGKARYIGASSMYAWQFARMLAVSDANGWARFVSMQPQYNLVYREEEREMLPLCRAEGVGVIPWSPLARGFLAGGRAAPKAGETERARTDDFSPRLYFRDADFKVVDAVSEVAKERGLSNMQVALAWVLKNPAVTAPIIGASKLGHLEEAVAALEVDLTDDEVKRLQAPYQPKPVLDHA